uniref:Ig-like domain-containing protein n=1 Tax=Pygocentrus nattereri TaxID=42514 RepID=A0AAR2J359_PYGNA
KRFNVHRCFLRTLLYFEGLHVLGPSDPLIVELGGSVMLPCYVEAPLPLEELEVEWKGADSGTLVHLFQDGESRPEAQNQAYSGRASFFTEEVERGNFSLLLTNLTTKDAGIYNFEIKEIEYLIVTGGHVVSAYVGEDITMNCSVDSHIPPEKLDEVSWKKVDQQIQVLIFLNGEVQPESTHERYADRVELFSREEIQKGNFSFRLKDLRTEDKGQYICEAFFGEFADNTTVEVQQLGFSSMHTGILLLCIIAFVVPVVLGYPAYVSLKRNDNSKRALAVQYTLVCCSNIALCLAFILWGVIEGFLTEASTCSALNLLRILFLFWIAPYLDTFKGMFYLEIWICGLIVLIRMSVLLILEIVCASSSVYLHYDLLDTLKYQKGNGERTVNDLRVILVPFECIFPIGCLVLQISAFCKVFLMIEILGQSCDCTRETCPPQKKWFTSGLQCIKSVKLKFIQNSGTPQEGQNLLFYRLMCLLMYSF